MVSTEVDQAASGADAFSNADNSDQGLVSWQSAFFAILALAFNVLLQNSGTISGTRRADRIKLRSSPIICAADTVLCLVKIIWLMATAGCSPRTATRWVWYDRFEGWEVEEAWKASGINQAWRWNAASFAIGALLQAIKVFGMYGIPGTQALAAVFLAAFIIPEILRLVAGPANAIELDETLAVKRALFQFDWFQGRAALLAMYIQNIICVWIFLASIPRTWLVDKSTSGTPNTFAWGLLAYLAHGIIGHLVAAALSYASIFLITTLIWLLAMCAKKPFLRPFLHWSSSRLTEAVESIRPFIANVLSVTPVAFQRIFRQVLALVYWMLLIYVSWLAGRYFTSVVCVFNTMNHIVNLLFIIIIRYLSLHALPYRLFNSGRFSEYMRETLGIKITEDQFRTKMFVVWNFVCLFQYFTCIYDNTGTYKPTWTEKLG